MKGLTNWSALFVFGKVGIEPREFEGRIPSCFRESPREGWPFREASLRAREISPSAPPKTMKGLTNWSALFVFDEGGSNVVVWGRGFPISLT
jgi:hypothetical protein